MKGIITCNVYARWLFNQTLSIYFAHLFKIAIWNFSNILLCNNPTLPFAICQSLDENLIEKPLGLILPIPDEVKKMFQYCKIENVKSRK